MECSRPVAVATAFGTISAAGLGPGPLYAVAAPVAEHADDPAGPAVRPWAAPPEGAITAANRAW